MAESKVIKNYTKMGIVGAAVVLVASLGVLAIREFGGNASISESVADVSTKAVNGSELRIAVIRMDAIQNQAKVLTDLRKQRETYENSLKSSLEKKQKELEKEKSEIEKSQEVLSRDALQKRVVEYQQKVSMFQREVGEKAQAIDTSFQKALVEIQEKHLDGIVNAIIEKKNLSLVLDGRLTRVSPKAAPALDITDEVVSALDKNIKKFTMDKPKGF